MKKVIVIVLSLVILSVSVNARMFNRAQIWSALNNFVTHAEIEKDTDREEKKPQFIDSEYQDELDFNSRKNGF